MKQKSDVLIMAAFAITVICGLTAAACGGGGGGGAPTTTSNPCDVTGTPYVGTVPPPAVDTCWTACCRRITCATCCTRLTPVGAPRNACNANCQANLVADGEDGGDTCEAYALNRTGPSAMGIVMALVGYEQTSRASVSSTQILSAIPSDIWALLSAYQQSELAYFLSSVGPQDRVDIYAFVSSLSSANWQTLKPYIADALANFNQELQSWGIKLGVDPADIWSRMFIYYRWWREWFEDPALRDSYLSPAAGRLEKDEDLAPRLAA